MKRVVSQCLKPGSVAAAVAVPRTFPLLSNPPHTSRRFFAHESRLSLAKAGTAGTTQKRQQQQAQQQAQQQQQQQQQAQSASKEAETASEMLTRAAEARRRIAELWNKGYYPGRSKDARALMIELGIVAGVSRDADVSSALGEALQRLLLMLVPLEGQDATAIVTLLDLAARNDAKIPLRTVQHLFSRCSNYAEAVGIFHALRRAKVAMTMDSYYAMIYCLQRLEEESWGKRLNDERQRNGGGALSEEALDFIIKGCDNQLLPEDKPWLGRVMFGRDESPHAASANGSEASYDDLSVAWVERYRSGQKVDSH